MAQGGERAPSRASSAAKPSPAKPSAIASPPGTPHLMAQASVIAGRPVKAASRAARRASACTM